MKSEDIQVLVGDTLEDLTICNSVDNRYITIKAPIGSGQFGSIYHAIDEHSNSSLVIKISEDQRVLKNEIKALIRINKNKFNKEAAGLVPDVNTYGLFFHRKSELSSPKHDVKLFYYVMPYFGSTNLEQHVENCK